MSAHSDLLHNQPHNLVQRMFQTPNSEQAKASRKGSDEEHKNASLQTSYHILADDHPDPVRVINVSDAERIHEKVIGEERRTHESELSQVRNAAAEIVQGVQLEAATSVSELHPRTKSAASSSEEGVS